MHSILIRSYVAKIVFFLTRKIQLAKSRVYRTTIASKKGANPINEHARLRRFYLNYTRNTF